MATLNNSRTHTIATVKGTFLARESGTTYAQVFALRTDRRILYRTIRATECNGETTTLRGGYTIKGRVKVGVPLTVETLTRYVTAIGRTIVD